MKAVLCPLQPSDVWFGEDILSVIPIRRMTGPNPSGSARRLAAILAADVAGYARLMDADEEKTFARLGHGRDILIRRIEQHGGRVANTAGDAVLAEFASVVDSVRCAIAAQEELADTNSTVPMDRRLEFRIGLHVGDVMTRDGDLFGDSVNIAARLQALAAPGGITLSATAYEQARKPVPVRYVDLGLQHVKNIAEPVRTYAIDSLTVPAAPSAPGYRETLPLPAEPSVAVLPFTNMSGDDEQEYFSDGITEDIITALSRFKWFFVIARNSSFAYKGRNVDIRQIGRELGVRYVIEGSVRKAGKKLRITGQLIEAENGRHIWAERYDGDLEDVFDLQDRITEKVVSALEPKIEAAEIERARRRRPSDVGAYDLYLRGLTPYHSMTREGLDEAARLFRQALERDPRDAASAGLLGSLLAFQVAQGWAADPRGTLDQSVNYCRLAQKLNPNDAETLALAGRTMAYATADFDAALEIVDRAVAINPNSAKAWAERGWAYQYALRPDVALVSLERAMRLSPMDPMKYSTLTALALVYIQRGELLEAVETARQAVRANASFTSGLRALASAFALNGLLEEAQVVVQQCLKLEPHFTISEWRRRGLGATKAERFIEGMRLAGLPE